MINVEHLHELARLFMYQFPKLKSMSLDEFLSQHSQVLTTEQLLLGFEILNLFDKITCNVNTSTHAHT
jgi:hypothetical protein